MRKIIDALVILAFGIPVMATPPPENVFKKLTETIRKHCPGATMEVTEKGFKAKHGTIVYTLHAQSKTGEVYAQTYQQEGPNYKGFILTISLHDGKYEGAAMVPQTLQGPYFPTFIDAVPVENGKKHYQIHFSYGNGLDRELMKAILDTIPRSRLQQPAGGDAKGREQTTPLRGLLLNRTCYTCICKDKSWKPYMQSPHWVV